MPIEQPISGDGRIVALSGSRWFRVSLQAIPLLGLVVGVVARFRGLDQRPLAVDEYYFARAVDFILDTGLPMFPSGGYYVRGLLPQYVAAGSALVLGATEFAYRLPAALFSLLGVALAYVYARRFLARAPAAAVALMMAVSSWQIEFAQFARMYAPLQCMTLLFLLALDEAYFRNRWSWRYLPHILAVLTTATHFLGLLLTPLLFIPFVDGRLRERFAERRSMIRYLLASLATLALCYVFVEFDFRDLGVSDGRPVDYVSTSRVFSDFWYPSSLLWNPGGGPETNLLLVGSLLALCAASMVWIRRRRPDWTETDLLLLLLFAFTAAHLFLLTLMVLAVLLARGSPASEWFQPRRRRRWLGATIFVGVGWILYAIASIERIAGLAGGATAWIRPIGATFFGWPQLYRAHYLPWSQTLPLLGLLFVGAVAQQFFSKCRGPLHESLRSPAFVVIWIGSCLTLLRPSQMEIRYVFFIYPVLLCTLTLSISELMRRGVRSARGDRGRSARVAAAAAVVLFALTSDFNPAHILHLTDDRVVFRRGEFQRFSDIWYARNDFASPAEFVNEVVVTSRSKVKVVVIDQPPVSYYLRRPHAVYYDRDSRRFSNVSRARGTVDLWSNRPLLSRPDELRRYTRGATTVWLLRAADPSRSPVDLHQVWGWRLQQVSRMHLGRDAMLEVVRVTLRGEERELARAASDGLVAR